MAAGEEVRLARPEPGARVEAAFDGGILLPVPGSIASPEAGDHWLAVASRDRAGNLSAVRWVRVRVDAEPPRLELETRPAPVADEAGRHWLPPGAAVVARAADDLAGVERVRLDLGGRSEEATGAELTVELPASGTLTVRGSATDRVANRSPESVLELSIDDRPPEIEIRVAGPGYPKRPATSKGRCSRPPAGSKPSHGTRRAVSPAGLPGSPATTSRRTPGGVPWSLGAHIVEAVADDRVSNRGRDGPYRFTTDGAGPEIRWRVITAGATDDPGETYYLPPVEVMAEASDQPAGLHRLWSSTDGATFEVLEGPVTIASERLWLKASDRAGNLSEVEARWQLDVEPPEFLLAAPGGSPTAAGGRPSVARGAAIAVTARDLGVGVASVTYELNRGWPVPQPSKPLGERIVCRRLGSYTLTIEAIDRLGNTFRGEWEVFVRRQGIAG